MLERAAAATALNPEEAELIKSGLFKRLEARQVRSQESHSRKKRSDLFKLVNEWKIPGKSEITWRLVSNKFNYAKLVTLKRCRMVFIRLACLLGKF